MSKIGDRYKHEENGWCIVHQITEVNERKCKWKCVFSNNDSLWRLGTTQIHFEIDVWDDWEYLGNFSKDVNIINLYNILNGD